MTETQWQRACVLCATRGRTKRLESGHCCVDCASWLTTQVADIARLAADAAEARAKAICGHCPVLEQCRDYAMGQSRLQGIWGAMTSNERRQARRKERGWA